MARFGALLALALGLAAAGSVRAQGSHLETLWNCKDANGRTTLTNQKSDTTGKDCRIVQQDRVTVVPAAKTKSPANFPKESPSDRAASKAKQKDTIEKELTQEQAMLADARKKLAEQEAIRTGDEKNYSKVIERLRPYKDTVEVHEKNVEALKRELTNLSR
jgi:septal ring factor EnvC (AmiA/AmiB activator)